jgi:hypothetical protein
MRIYGVVRHLKAQRSAPACACRVPSVATKESNHPVRTVLKPFVLGLVLTLLAFGDAIAAQLSISWVDNSGGVASFSLERRTSSSSTYVVVATLPAGQTSWIDSSVLSGTSYCYRVRAVTTAATSSYSNEACKSSGTALTVSKAGTGAGTVVSSPAGINCGSVCSATFAPGTLITLSATPASGSTFSGWSGAGCTGTASCLLSTNVSTTVTATFSAVTSTGGTSPVSLTLMYNGKLRDRVGKGNLARAPDGALDGTFTVQLQGSIGRTVTSVKLEGPAPELWDTEAATSSWLLGVATSMDGALINNGTTMGVSFTLAGGGSFVVFASESGGFSPGRAFKVTARFSDGTTASASTTIPGLTLAYNGKLRDRVGASNTARAADGTLDGVLTARLYAPGGRTITRLALQSSAAGQWDTDSTTASWLLGVATSLDNTLLNNSTTMSVSFAIGDGGTFVLFASDNATGHFASGRTLTLTARFSDGTTWTGSARVP